MIAAYGRQAVVESDGEKILCVRRGKKSGVVCGDQVLFEKTSADQGIIESILPRSSLLYRSDNFKEKMIAANVTQAIIVLAAIPSFSEELLNRCLIAARTQKIKPLILLNKSDLIETEKAARDLALYENLGFPLLKMSAKKDISALLPFLQNHTSVFVGQSGMGKSTLVNALIPKALQATSEISTALDSGKHTTTHTRLYHLNAASHLIDSPGVQEFGLRHLSPDEITRSMPDFSPFLGLCKFRDCRHLNEPGCAILQALESGKIDERRMAVFRKLAGK